MNPVDDVKFTRPLVKALCQHVDAFAESMVDVSEYGALEKARPAAVSWVYYSVLVAWAEDHGLIDPWLRKEARDDRAAFYADGDGDARQWLATACASLASHPVTECLMDPRFSHLRHATPSVDACSALIDWWTEEAPSLRYETTAGPASISGWLPGDMLQALSTERVKSNAFCQTPWWVADFIIDLTLIPAAETFPDVALRTIDPCCGTGHFLLRKIEYLWELYTTGAVHGRQVETQSCTGWRPVDPAEAVSRILAGVHGCELDPLTAAVARLRFVVATGDLLHRSGLITVLRLDSIPHTVRPVIAVGNSLLAGVVDVDTYARIHPHISTIANLGVPVEPEDQLGLFSAVEGGGPTP
jgi:hypothetical protein